MKQAIIFGGAFNPPSRGHVWIVSRCAQIAREIGAEIWILPSGERRDKQIGVSDKLRIKLCRAMICDADTQGVKVRIVTTELAREVMVETIDTIHELAHDYPDYQLHWVFGADAYDTMSRWRGGEWMLGHLDMLIVTRIGYPLLERQNVRVIQGLNDDVSSTLIRRAHASRQSVDDLVTSRVAQLLANGNIRYTSE